MSGIEFNQLMVLNADQLRPFAFSLTRDIESAKDLFQETLFRALANKEKYNQGTNIKAWMFTIMRNIFINDYNRRARQKIIFDNTKNEFLIDSNQVQVASDAEANVNLKDISKSMNALPEIFKKPFEMFLEGYRYYEISLVLQEPLGTIKSRIHFARKLLKENLTRF